MSGDIVIEIAGAVHRRERDLVERAYADYFNEITPTFGMPHCDEFVLHAPLTCEYCDKYPARQRARELCRIAFTGQVPLKSQRPCPAELFRDAETIHRWGGNRPA